MKDFVIQFVTMYKDEDKKIFEQIKTLVEEQAKHGNTLDTFYDLFKEHSSSLNDPYYEMYAEDLKKELNQSRKYNQTQRQKVFDAGCQILSDFMDKVFEQSSKEDLKKILKNADISNIKEDMTLDDVQDVITTGLDPIVLKWVADYVNNPLRNKQIKY